MDASLQTDCTEAVGKTTVVTLKRISAGCAAHVGAKVESKNPGGSVKDRIAVFVLCM